MRYALLTISLFFAFLPQAASATVFYIDFNCVANADTTCGTGLASSTPSSSLDQFTESARSAGDFAVVRRGQASTTGITDVTFLSDGTISNPITVTADFDNIWGDFATSSVTYNVTPGTAFIATSASTTEAFPGKWIYFEGDCFENMQIKRVNNCDQAYEIEKATSTGIQLYMPYRGAISGTGKNARIMPSAPIWNTAAGDFQWLLSGDDNWRFKGIHVRGTDAAGNIFYPGLTFTMEDMIIEGNGAADVGLLNNGEADVAVYRTRFFNHVTSVRSDLGFTLISNSFLNCNNVASSQAVFSNSAGQTQDVENSIIQGCTAAFQTRNTAAGASTRTTVRNVTIQGQTNIQAFFMNNDSQTPMERIFFEDFDGTVNDNRQQTIFDTATTSYIASSTSLILRSGGGPVSIQITPTTDLSTSTPFAFHKLFEYPIYTNTASKQYDVYFMSPSDTWNENPARDELWIECEYWSHVGATSTRSTKKSTGTVDFSGSTAWQSLSVTCQPTQTGILYLRGWYGKTKESDTNIFYVDGTPVIQ